MRHIARNITLSILSTVAVLSLAACGSDEKQPVTVVTAPAAAPVANPVMPTKGQQLQDIQKAYDDGTISRDEYKEQKARILAE